MNLRIKEPNELEEVTQYFTTLIHEAALYLTPTPKDERKKIDNIPFHIRELVTEKRRARSRWQRSRNNDDSLIYNRLRRKLHNALTNAKNKTFEYYVYTASPSKGDCIIWKSPKEFKRPQISIRLIRISDRSWAKSDREKVTTFAEHLEQVFTPHSNINHNDSEIENFLEIPCQMFITYQTLLT
jgi:chlorite dismutase